MSNAIITPQQNAVIQEYLSQNEDATIHIPILGHRWSSCRSVLYRLVWKTDYWDDPTYNYLERTSVQINGHRVTLIVELYESNDSPRMAVPLQGTNVFLLVYDVTDRRTFDFIKKVYTEVFGAEEQGRPICRPIWVCAGKSERPQEDWKVSAQEGEEFSTSIGARFLNFSGRTGLGLDDAFIHQIATEGVLDLAGANYRGPNQILYDLPRELWYHHLSAMFKAVRDCFRKRSQPSQ
ncbi:hypothetical protein EDB80DRAFT_711230 [Ilyonectria destructans]|nr:hypothetical protein EDB80DRAFT_711230 [Ilyonectria destructans]